MSDQTVELLLRLTLDGQGQSQMRSGLADLKNSMAQMRAEAEKTRKAMNDALSKGDTQGAKKLQAELDQIEGKLKEVGETAQSELGARMTQAVRESSQRMREMAERIQNVGRTMAIAGGVVTAGMAKSANDYAQKAGPLEETSRKWLATSKELEQANLRLGRASAQALQPWYDRLAQITNMAAEYAEKHPNTMAGLATAAVAAVGAGGVMEAAGQGLKLVADSRLLAAAVMQQNAARMMLQAAGIQSAAAKGGAASTAIGKLTDLLTKPTFGFAVDAMKQSQSYRLAMATNNMPKTIGGVPLTAPGGVTAASLGAAVNPLTILGGVSLGTMIYDQFAEAAGRDKAGTIAAKTLSAAAFSVGTLVGGNEKGAEWFKATAKALGVLGDTAEETAKKLDANSDAYKLYAQYIQAEKEAKRTNERQRVQIEREGEQERTRIVQQFGVQRTQLEAQYAAQVSQAQRQHNTEMQRMAQDHFRAMRDLQDQYECESQQAEQQYQQQQASLATGLNNQLASLQQNFQSSMESLRREHLRRLQQMEEDHNARVDDLVGARDALGLAAENRNYARQKKAEQQAYNDQIADLRRQLKEQTAAAREEYRKQQAELQRNFEAQQAQRDAEYERQKQQADQQYAIQRARAEEDYKAQMEQMADQHQAEMRENARQFADEMRQSRDNQRQKLQELQRAYQEESRQRKEALDTQTKELLNIQQTGQTDSLNSAKQYWADLIAQQKAATGQSSTPSQGGGRASGGYASYGKYTLGEVGEEFVLTHATTRAWEAAVGGRLTQERMLMQLAASRRRVSVEGRGQNVTINASYSFSGTLGAAEKDWIRRASYESAQQGLLDALGG
jgi:hypothetical protein